MKISPPNDLGRKLGLVKEGSRMRSMDIEKSKQIKAKVLRRNERKDL